MKLSSRERSCLYASGDILGRELAEKLEKPENLEDFLSKLLNQSIALLTFEYKLLSDKDALLTIKKSAFWEIVDRTSIDKIKKAGCRSERLFIEAALREFFPRAEVIKVNCRAEGDKECELTIRLYLE